MGKNVTAPPSWIRDGVRVLYESSPGRQYSGRINGEPFLLGGHTWCVNLCEMSKEYRDGQRSTVNAAACNCLTELANADVATPSQKIVEPQRWLIGTCAECADWDKNRWGSGLCRQGHFEFCDHSWSVAADFGCIHWREKDG